MSRRTFSRSAAWPDKRLPRLRCAPPFPEKIDFVIDGERNRESVLLDRAVSGMVEPLVGRLPDKPLAFDAGAVRERWGNSVEI